MWCVSQGYQRLLHQQDNILHFPVSHQAYSQLCAVTCVTLRKSFCLSLLYYPSLSYFALLPVSGRAFSYTLPINHLAAQD